MIVKAIKKIQSTNREFNLFQDSVLGVMNPILDHCPLLDGTLLQKVDLKAGQNVVPHGLGRTLLGWIVTRKDRGATISDLQSQNPLPDKNLWLVTNLACTCDFYVF